MSVTNIHCITKFRNNFVNLHNHVKRKDYLQISKWYLSNNNLGRVFNFRQSALIRKFGTPSRDWIWQTTKMVYITPHTLTYTCCRPTNKSQYQQANSMHLIISTFGLATQNKLQPITLQDLDSNLMLIEV